MTEVKEGLYYCLVAERICEAPGCDRPVERSRKACSGHRHRFRTTGSYGDTPLKEPTPRGLSLYEMVRYRGWDVTATGCWEYKGGKFANGYGQVKGGGDRVPKLAHRIVYEAVHGSIPEGLVVRHSCDNPPCVNPNHLLTGTVLDNVKDREDRNRTARGNRSVGFLTDEDVAAIRRVTDSTSRTYQVYEELAQLYGMSRSAIQRAALRVTYRHVP